ncbi:ABC transporter ATP-binding protein [Paenibacillus physcomitrellae]|uniref:Multidrug ABC transporter permease n=1 Tax=Paenibacillus physcomitrellae TaxID=1619311 RepID=A0ABQ1FW73_9BACL|nr:ABC transporter ATP-binding protein [Paenibacillus physcomitrellae]GGA32452.1 multidrug ABC transporter permease [Paenibacillus physcomitrellae]
MYSWKSFFRLIRDTRPSKAKLGIALGLSLISTIGGLVVPLLTRDLVDGFSLQNITPLSVILMVLAFVAQAVSGAVSIYLLNHVGQTVVSRLRDRLWSKLLSLSLPYYNEHRTGDTISRMTNDTAVVRGLISEHISGFVNGVISAVGAILILLFMDWKMTLITFVAVPLCVAVIAPVGRRLYLISKDTQDETASFTTTLNQALSEIRLVKSSNGERVEYENGQKGITKLLKLGIAEGKMQAIISPLTMFVIMLILVVIIGYGGMQVTQGRMTAGSLVAFILYLFQIIFPVTQVTQFFTQLQKAKGATQRIIETLEAEEEDIHTGQELTRLNEPIVLEELSFSYPGSEEATLERISFRVDPGKVTAIVGPSGGGKTTLFSLVERFYQPTDGVMKLGGTEVSRYSLRSWRGRIGYVSQESPLIAGSIRDNVLYGLERQVSEDELHEALRMAYADIFIGDFPEGMETQVGERGVKLSGGQRQRIAIARAILRNPDLLMLDEATSSLDSKSEAIVQEALSNLMKGRTTLVIAHRLSTVVDADQILFIEKGRITGRGTHAQLYEVHDLYREFADHQLKVRA